MIERAAKSKSAVSVLLEDFNDIDIYVEDTAVESKKIYTELINRVFADKYKIENVIPTGPSTKVISEWKRHNSMDDKRKRIFIIDGDYHLLNDSLKDYLSAEEQESHKGLFLLPKYCIENFLVDFKSLIEIVHDEDPIDDRIEIAKKLNLENWLIENESLKDLFIYNSICQKFNIGVKTSKYKVTNLGKVGHPGVCCSGLISNRINELKVAINSKNSKINIEKEYSSRYERVRHMDILSIVTGKDYLLPLLKKHINSKYDCSGISNTSFKIRIAKMCDISELLLLENELN